MKIMYEIEDGYVGKSRPHYVVIPDEDLEECETDQEKEELIESLVVEHFEQNIYPHWDRSQLKK